MLQIIKIRTTPKGLVRIDYAEPTDRSFSLVCCIPTKVISFYFCDRTQARDALNKSIQIFPSEYAAYFLFVKSIKEYFFDYYFKRGDDFSILLNASD